MDNNERDFLKTVRDAIFTNPFGTTRPALDREATGLTTDSANTEVLQRLVEKVGKTLASLQRTNRATARQLPEEDRQLLKFGMLFHTFHIFCDAYDTHIQQQVQHGDDCCQVSFARDALKMLSDHGFSDHEALRFFALFFQMRRAYFFIVAIAGTSQCVMNLRRALWNNVFTSDIGLYNQYLWNRMEDFSTMILGETGTGKGMAAAAIGRSGFIPFDDKNNRFKESFAKTFISINLSQYPEQLIESELFGHKKGSFTGAIDTHHGVFARCSPCGAIFLDEIGDVAVPVQIKLLQVLQARNFSPVGSHKTERFQGRVIAATNKSLQKLREDGEFRDDFYYRLCSDVIEVPPLRQRLSEHPGELQKILEVTVRRILGRESKQLVEEIQNYITAHQPGNYPWPGNIRELEQCARRILLNRNYSWQHPTTAPPADQLATDLSDGSLTANQLLSRYCTMLYQQHGTYEAVAQLTQLDRRTVKKHITAA